MSLQYRTLTGGQIAAALEDLAQLRITVFRDWPYLYDGAQAYERQYLAGYANSPGSVLVGAYDGARLVGAATGGPMEDHAQEFAAPFAALGIDLSQVFYCAESVLLAAWRGQGAGHAFFDIREAKARSLGRRHAAFCAVMRPDDHPLRPPGYRLLDPFWRARGYAPLDQAQARFDWKDVDQTETTTKTLQIWMRTL